MSNSQRTIIHTRVFRNGPDGGNPCPVLLDGDDLKAAHGKALAARFGAETIIIQSSKDVDSDFGLRYFVPNYEMEMCVHGTIAAVTVLQKMGRISKPPVKIGTVLGPISVDWKDEGGELKVTVFQFPPEFIDSNPAIDEACLALGISPTAVAENMGPIISVSTSRPKLMVPIMHRNILDRMEPDFEKLWNLCDQYGTTGFYPFAKSESGPPNAYSARQFPKRAGYNEDPATGVAACALGAYLTRYHRRTTGWHYFKIHQGHAMGKPSLLEVGAFLEKESITRTCVSGNARLLSEESIALDAI